MSETKQDMNNRCFSCVADFKRVDDTECSVCKRNICYNCQVKHGCNEGLWLSMEDNHMPESIKLIHKFAQDIIFAIDKDYKALFKLNDELNEKVKLLEKENKKFDSTVNSLVSKNARLTGQLCNNKYTDSDTSFNSELRIVSDEEGVESDQD